MNNLISKIKTPINYIVLNSNNTLEKQTVIPPNYYSAIFTNNIISNKNNDLIIKTNDEDNNIIIGNNENNINLNSNIIFINELSSNTNIIFNNNIIANDIVTFNDIECSTFQTENSNTFIKSNLIINSNNFNCDTINNITESTIKTKAITNLYGIINTLNNINISGNIVNFFVSQTINNSTSYLNLNNQFLLQTTTSIPTITLLTTSINNSDSMLTINTNILNSSNNNILFNNNNITFNAINIYNIPYIINQIIGTNNSTNNPQINKIYMNDNANQTSQTYCVINNENLPNINFTLSAIGGTTSTNSHLCSNTIFNNVIPTSTYISFLVLNKIANSLEYNINTTATGINENKELLSQSPLINIIEKILQLYKNLDSCHETIKEKVLLFEKLKKEFLAINKTEQKLINTIKELNEEYKNKKNEIINQKTEDDLKDLFFLLNGE
jgi:hypothetical protein